MANAKVVTHSLMTDLLAERPARRLTINSNNFAKIGFDGNN